MKAPQVIKEKDPVLFETYESEFALESKQLYKK